VDANVRTHTRANNNSRLRGILDPGVELAPLLLQAKDATQQQPRLVRLVGYKSRRLAPSAPT